MCIEKISEKSASTRAASSVESVSTPVLHTLIPNAQGDTFTELVLFAWLLCSRSDCGSESIKPLGILRWVLARGCLTEGA